MSTIAVALHHPGWVGPGWGPWFLLVPLLWLLVLGLLVALLTRRWRREARDAGFGPGGRPSPRRQAEATLAERFAKGDLDETEYRARLEVLRANA